MPPGADPQRIALDTCRSVVAAVSGGMDSVTMAHLLRERGADLVILAVDYGQRHRRELSFAAATARRLGAVCIQLDLTAAAPLLEGSALTDLRVAVPDGHYTDESMRLTVVPNRNAILLSLATAVAVSRGAEAVAFAAHSGDHAVYPDCRPAFVDAFTAMALSHQSQSRLQAAKRRNAASRPVEGPSPWKVGPKISETTSGDAFTGGAPPRSLGSRSRLTPGTHVVSTSSERASACPQARS